MTSLYDPTQLRRHTSARAEEVNAELLKIQTAFDELQAVVTSIITGTVVPQPLYTWRAYANNSNGTIDFTLGDPGDRSYIGLSFNNFDPDPSMDPSRYEWSLINGALGNFISFDTINVAGKPATQVVDDLNSLSLSLLAYQFDRQTLQDYVNDKLFVGGVAVNAVIVNEQNIRISADTALAETIALIGAKNNDGSAFIVDLTKAYVDPTTSFAVRLGNMVAATATAQASVQDLEQVVAELDFATATDISLLGAKNLAGDAWILNTSTVKVSPTETISQYINTQVAAAAGGAASVTEIYDAVITPTGGAHAKAVLRLDVNGHVIGYSATNDGTLGAIVFDFDKFTLRDLSGNNLLIAEGGVIKMPNVEIDTLKVGTVITESVAPTALRKYYGNELGSNVAVNYSGTTNLGTIITTKDIAGSDIEISYYMRMRVLELAGYFQVVKTVGGVDTIMDTIWYWSATLGDIGAFRSDRNVQPYRRRFSGLGAGAITWSLRFVHYAHNQTGGVFEAGSGLFAEEIKR